MNRVIVAHSGGQDSLAIMLDMMEKFGKENVISIGFQYGQKHFNKENDAAIRFCDKHNIKRTILQVPIYQINIGRCLTDLSVNIPNNMEHQADTVVNYRNTIFATFAAGFALQNNANYIALGVTKDDELVYKDCRKIFYKLLEMTLQAGITKTIKGSDATEKDIVVQNGNFYIPEDRLDMRILTPLIDEWKVETVKRISDKYGVDVYKDSWSCYVGSEKGPCHVCPSCRERELSFTKNGLVDPIL